MTDKSLRVYFLYVGFVCLIFVIAWHRPLMSPDSWALYDLSRWLWHGETVTGTRQYRVGTGLPISHPFFFPFLSGGLDQLFGTGFRSGLVVNIAAILLLPWLIYLAIKPIAESRKGAVFISWGATVGLCLNWFFLEEVVAGRTIPVAACLVALALRFFFLGAQQRYLVFAIQLGLVLGVLALTRFDTLSFGVLLAVGTWLVWAPGRKRWMALLITTVLFLVGNAPYLVYSIQCCGTVLATETGGIAITAPPTSPTTYWPVPPPTLLDAPAIWMERLVRSMLDSGRALLLAVLISPLPALLAFTPIFPGPPTKHPPQPATVAIIPILALGSIAFGPVLLSFPQGRYFVLPVVFICSIVAANWGGSLFDHAPYRHRLKFAAICAGIIGIAACGYGWSRSTPLLPQSLIDAAAECATGGRLLVKGQRGPEIAARSRAPTLLEPDNWSFLVAAEKDQFLHDYRASAIFDPKSGICERLPNAEPAFRN